MRIYPEEPDYRKLRKEAQKELNRMMADMADEIMALPPVEGSILTKETLEDAMLKLGLIDWDQALKALMGEKK